MSLFRWLNLIWVVATFIAYLSPHINPEKAWMFSIFGLIYPWLLLGNVLFILFWIWGKSWFILISLVCILVGLPHVTRLINMHAPPTNTTNAFRVASLNAFSFQKIYGSERDWKALRGNKKMKSLYAFLKKEKIDILCLQEFRRNHKIAANFFEELKAATGLEHHFFDKKSSLTIISRFPIQTSQFIIIDDFLTGQYVDLKIQDQNVRVFNLHLKSNELTGIADNLSENAKVNDKKTYLDIQTMFALFKNNAQIRARQANGIAKKIDDSPYPVLLCGDWNDTPLSYTYRRLHKRLQDGFIEAGSGFGITYAGSIPLLRIDYIMADSSFQFLHYTVQRENFSDHYPVVSSIRLKN